MPRREQATASQQYAAVQNQAYFDTVGAPPPPGTAVYLDSPQLHSPNAFYTEKAGACAVTRAP